jgi:hypothetical protein
MDIVKKTAQMKADLSAVVTQCNDEGNFGTAQIAQTALQQVASLATRCAAEAEQKKSEATAASAE